MNNNEHKQPLPLATEIIRTLKRIILWIVVGWVLTIAGFIWYISLPVEVATTTETITVDSEGNGNANYINDSEMGDINNGKDNSAENNN